MYADMFSQRGFALLEVLVATTIVTVALAGLAQLFVLSTNANRSAKSITLATVLAIDKMEQLRSLMWGFDSLGLPLSDPRLAASPSSALRENTAGFCDFLDKAGHSVGEGTVPPLGTIYARRWSIEPLPADPGNMLVLQVLVTQRFSRDTSEGPKRSRLPDEARLVSIKARKAP